MAEKRTSAVRLSYVIQLQVDSHLTCPQWHDLMSIAFNGPLNKTQTHLYKLKARRWIQRIADQSDMTSVISIITGFHVR
ncbi:hypothetical protein CEXT_213131 [Caerostris extrusa]|uniref:Uncharacterized protein n=1 Tax=Caerostris extrusa TaxID=172846 RepID=A0AAV4Q184_CAEEX|nr:hypothetical protein CEXT_213131 [Caerostris extrusa]